jgi:hypothetical protein
MTSHNEKLIGILKSINFKNNKPSIDIINDIRVQLGNKKISFRRLNSIKKGIVRKRVLCSRLSLRESIDRNNTRIKNLREQIEELKRSNEVYYDSMKVADILEGSRLSNRVSRDIMIAYSESLFSEVVNFPESPSSPDEQESVENANIFSPEYTQLLNEGSVDTLSSGIVDVRDSPYMSSLNSSVSSAYNNSDISDNTYDDLEVIECEPLLQLSDSELSIIFSDSSNDAYSPQSSQFFSTTSSPQSTSQSTSHSTPQSTPISQSISPPLHPMASLHDPIAFQRILNYDYPIMNANMPRTLTPLTNANTLPYNEDHIMLSI